MSFFKNIDGVLVEGKNFVYGDGYELVAAEKDDYAYPVDGWWWFDDYETAAAHLIKTTTVTRAQAKLAMLQMGYLDQLESIMADPSTPRHYKIAWEDALLYRRDSQTIVAISAILGLSDEKVDEIFQLAGTLDRF